jgi:hypothetical protein
MPSLGSAKDGSAGRAACSPWQPCLWDLGYPCGALTLPRRCPACPPLSQDYALGQIERNAPQRAAELRTLLSRLGPSFVKIGQALR